MITQAIKNWLRKLFAWWPWKEAPADSYAQASVNVNLGGTQESLLRTTNEGSIPQTGISSVAVEQGRDGNYPDDKRLTGDERSGRPVPPQASPHNEHPRTNDTTSDALSQTNHRSENQANLSFEQRLVFLKYLYHRGTINEGFEANHIPEQYRKRRQ